MSHSATSIAASLLKKVAVITDKTRSVLWMYKLHNGSHLLSEISFVDEFCKFSGGVCFENHFCLNVDYNV